MIRHLLLLTTIFLTLSGQVNAEPTRPAYRMRATLYQNDKIVAFATWIAYEDQETKIVQLAETPYASAVPLTSNGTAKEAVLKTGLNMTVRPFHHGSVFYLNVDFDFRDTLNMNRYTSADLTEDLPTNSSFSGGGDFEGKRTGQGWTFDLTWNPGDTSRADIEVQPITAVDTK